MFRSTRFAELGYRQDSARVWRIVDVSTSAAIGPAATQTEGGHVRIYWGACTLKTGERVEYEYKDSWNRRYYSFDGGKSWHTSKTRAYHSAHPTQPTDLDRSPIPST